MSRYFLVVLACLCLTLSGCGDGGHRGGGDPCAGPVPCFTNQVGDTIYVFWDDSSWDYLAVVSNGVEVVVLVYWVSGERIYFVEGWIGPVDLCHTVQIDTWVEIECEYGTANCTLTPWPGCVEGPLTICGEWLTVDLWDSCIGLPHSVSYEAQYEYSYPIEAAGPGFNQLPQLLLRE